MIIVVLLLSRVDITVLPWPEYLSHLKGPAESYSDCCSYTCDLDSDGDIDLADVAIYQNGFDCVGELCGYIVP